MVIKTAVSPNSIFVGNKRASESNRADNQKQNRKTLFAGDMKKVTDKIAIKRKQAQKKALKLVGDVFDREKKLDKSMQNMLDQCEELREKRIGYKDSIQKIEENRSDITEYYKVSEDSDEYKNLELLRKEKASKILSSGVKLTDQEEEKLEQIHAAGLTDFQKAMLDMDSAVEEYEGKISAAESAIDFLPKSWYSVKIERLKKENMKEASEQAEDIMMAANKEIIGELRKEAMDHVEEKLEKTVEAAKKQAEKKKEQEEKLEKKKEKNEKLDHTIEKANDSGKDTVSSQTVQPDHLDMEKDIDTITSYNSKKSKTNRELEKMIDELGLIMEDLKGAQVDKAI